MKRCETKSLYIASTWFTDGIVILRRHPRLRFWRQPEFLCCTGMDVGKKKSLIWWWECVDNKFWIWTLYRYVHLINTFYDFREKMVDLDAFATKFLGYDSFQRIDHQMHCSTQSASLCVDNKHRYTFHWRRGETCRNSRECVLGFGWDSRTAGDTRETSRDHRQGNKK